MPDYPHRVDGGPDRRFKVYQKDRVISVPKEGGNGMPAGPLAVALASAALPIAAEAAGATPHPLAVALASAALPIAAEAVMRATPHVARAGRKVWDGAL